MGYNHTSPELHNAERAAEEHLARLTDVRVPRPFVSITKLDNEKVTIVNFVFLLWGVNVVVVVIVVAVVIEDVVVRVVVAFGSNSHSQREVCSCENVKEACTKIM